MTRLAAAVLLLAACAAAPRGPHLTAPGLELRVEGGRWLLLTKFSNPGPDTPSAVFDENGGPDDAPPAAPVVLNPAGFDVSALPPAKDKPDSYRLMRVSDAAVGAGARGMFYLHQAERGEVYPLILWGLPPDAFDGLSPARAEARLRELFPSRKSP